MVEIVESLKIFVDVLLMNETNTIQYDKIESKECNTRLYDQITGLIHCIA